MTFGLLSKLEFLQDWASMVIATINPALMHNLRKYHALKKVHYLAAIEGIEGDYLEFGVFRGGTRGPAQSHSGASIHSPGLASSRRMINILFTSIPHSTRVLSTSNDEYAGRRDRSRFASSRDSSTRR
jgi:hypothetical protein